jgi:hypothetical protein
MTLLDRDLAQNGLLNEATGDRANRPVSRVKLIAECLVPGVYRIRRVYRLRGTLRFIWSHGRDGSSVGVEKS